MFEVVFFLTRAGPGVFEHPPQVFRKYLKNGGACAAVFGAPVHRAFPHKSHFVKISDPGH